MKTINLWVIMLTSIITLASCRSSHLPANLRADYFLLTPQNVKEYLERDGFSVQKIKLMIYQNRPVWLVEAREDNMLMEIYGFRYFVPENNIRLIIPSTDDLILYHGAVLNIKDDDGLYLELEH